METTFRCLGVRASAEPCGHRRPVSAFEFDGTGRTYTASRDGTVKCWDGRALRELSCVDECGCWVNDLAFIGDNTSATTTTTRLRKRSQTIAHNFFSFLFFFLCVCALSCFMRVKRRNQRLEGNKREERSAGASLFHVGPLVTQTQANIHATLYCHRSKHTQGLSDGAGLRTRGALLCRA